MADGGEEADVGPSERAVAPLAPPSELRSAVTKDGLRVDVVSGRIAELYDVGKPVGKGKFSTVYKAARRSDGLSVALKRVAIFDIMDASSREKCLKEIKLVQSLDHDNIIRYLDGFIENAELILVFEYAEAGDLKRQLRKAKERDARFDERVVWKYFSQIADAVAHMHGKRIMHRDLKPANIFLTLNGTVKVGDLGLGRLLSENTIEAHSKVGTPLYMSPEVLRGKGYELKSDIWSLGCILYELAMLKSPFKEEGLNLYGLFAKITEGRYPPVSPVYSDELRSLVERMLRQDPSQRPDTDEVATIAAAMRERTTRARAASTAASTAAAAAAVVAPVAVEVAASPPTMLPPPTMPSRPTSATQVAPLRVEVPPMQTEHTGVDTSPRVTIPTPMAVHTAVLPDAASPTRGTAGTRDARGSPHARPRLSSGTDSDAPPAPADADDAVGYIAIMEAAAAVARDAGLPDPFPDRPPTSSAPPIANGTGNGHSASQRPGTRGRARPESASRRRPSPAADNIAAPPPVAGIAMPRPAIADAAHEGDAVIPPRSRLRRDLSNGDTAPLIRVQAPTPVAASAAALAPARAQAAAPMRPNMAKATPAAVTGSDDSPPSVNTSFLPLEGLLQIIDSSAEMAAMMVWEWLHVLLASQSASASGVRELSNALREVKHHIYLCAVPASSTYATFLGVLRILAALLQLAANLDAAILPAARTLQDNVTGLQAGDTPPFAAAGSVLQTVSRTCVHAAAGLPHLPASVTPATVVAGAGAPVIRLLAQATLWAMHVSGWRGAAVRTADSSMAVGVDEDIEEDAADADDLITGERTEGELQHVTDDDDDDGRVQGRAVLASTFPTTDAADEHATAAAWNREHERVRHRLQAVDRANAAGMGDAVADASAQVTIAAAALMRAPTGGSGWSSRLTSLQRHAAVVHASRTPSSNSMTASRALERIADACNTELEAITRIELRWNGAAARVMPTPSPVTGRESIPELVAQYRAALEASTEMQAHHARLEASVHLLVSKAAATEEELQRTLEAVDERAAEMTSTDRVQVIRRSLAQLVRDNKALEMKVQVLRTQVMRAQQAYAQTRGHDRRGRGGSDSEGDDA